MLKTGFLPSDTFRPYADLDGAAAARFLQMEGFVEVDHMDMGTNGVAIGYDYSGNAVILSTNGYLTLEPSLMFRDLVETSVYRKNRG